ncbi:hypothetical protein [uncultured Desulfobacter sp.]|uniref:hypothetical protein n=1 Tax=uncultured Desulfobacter sp. TaxID=240139 RepID=UPI002AAA6AAA|nr:hypothetical protein [uncultured Desulfobacter sp.]
MDKKRIIGQAKDTALLNWQSKILKLEKLESDIQALIREFVELTGVQIKDIQLYDPETGEVQFETDL